MISGRTSAASASDLPIPCLHAQLYSPGVTFGKTPLIKLSPKKTVEGFVGAFICTLIFAVLVRRVIFPLIYHAAHVRFLHAVGYLIHEIPVPDLSCSRSRHPRLEQRPMHSELGLRLAHLRSLASAQRFRFVLGAPLSIVL